LFAAVTGTGPFSYEWQLNGTNLPNGIITTVAGNGTSGYFGDGGAATNAEFFYLNSVAVDASGNLFIVDGYNERIRMVGTNGNITTVAGNGTNGYSGDGEMATNAELSNPVGMVVDANGNLFISDIGNNRIRKVGADGIISTIAGNGTPGYSGDGGAATNAELFNPEGVAVDATGNLFIADYSNSRIRKVDTNGLISTVAGDGRQGYGGDGGVATNAEFGPYGLAVDAVDKLFIGDANNNRVREVSSDGEITTVAGDGAGAGTGGYESYFSGDGGPATNAELNLPQGVAVVDATEDLFIADYANHRIRRVGADGVITTVAGNGTGGYAGDGDAALKAELNFPIGVAVDASGNLFIADTGNECVRKVVILGPTLVLDHVGVGNAGAYEVVVSNPYGSVTSSVVNVTVVMPVVLSAPQMAMGETNFAFQLSGPAGGNYVLQTSTNLLNWSSVSTSTITSGGTLTLTNAIPDDNRRFYRVFLP
jgi:sugar lactone lactonase YvrE